MGQNPRLVNPRARDEPRYQREITTRQTQPPKSLYKYTSLDTLERILDTGEVRWCSPSCFNDPFDAQWDIMWQVSLQEFQDRYREAWRERLLGRIDWQGMSSTHRKSLGEARIAAFQDGPQGVERALDSLIRDEIMRDRKRITASFTRRLRMFCLAAVGDSVLMWSHYGDHHRGAILEVGSRILEETWRVPVKPVNYVAELPRVYDDETLEAMLVRGETSDEPGFEHWVYSKATDWRYEQEWRFASLASRDTQSDRMNVKLPINAVRSVKFGCRRDAKRAQALADRIRALWTDVHIQYAHHRLGNFAIEYRDDQI